MLRVLFVVMIATPLALVAPGAARAETLVSFVIEATPPDYQSPDLREPDFGGCVPGDWTDFPVSNPNYPNGVEVHNDAVTVVRAIREPLSWRPDLMTVHGIKGGNPTQNTATRAALHRRVSAGDYPEIAAIHLDAGVRPNPGVDIPYTGTVRFGPLLFDAVRGRSYADIESLQTNPAGDTLLINYRRGGSASIVVEQATPAKTRLRVDVAYDPTSAGLYLEATNMFKDAATNDTALIRWTDAGGVERVDPVMAFPGGTLSELTMLREVPSDHNSRGPDIRIGEFVFRDDGGGLVPGFLRVQNQSFATQCAEVDNVVLAFSLIPEPGSLILVATGAATLLLGALLRKGAARVPLPACPAVLCREASASLPDKPAVAPSGPPANRAATRP